MAHNPKTTALKNIEKLCVVVHMCLSLIFLLEKSEYMSTFTSNNDKITPNKNLQ